MRNVTALDAVARHERLAALNFRSPWLALGGLVLVSTGVRSWAGAEVPVPWIAPDEMVYGLVGRSLYGSGSLDVLGGPTPFYSLVVPAFVGLPLSVFDVGLGYDVLKVLQALVMSLTAVPVYLWGRSLVSRRWALSAAALTIALPGLVYSGLLMTEVLFYPVLLLVAWAMARAIERPTRRRQLLLAAAIAFAVSTRLQALVLMPALVTAVGVDAVLGRSAATARRLVPTLALVGAVVIGWIAWRAAGGGAGLGGYDVVAHESYAVGQAARYVLYHVGSLTILIGVFPLVALLLLLIGAGRRGEPDPARRAFLAVTGALTAWLVLEVGVFASRYVGRLAERDLIGLAPLLFLALVVWIERGAPRPYWAMSLVGVGLAASLVVLPLRRIVTSSAPPDAPTLTALHDLRQATSLTALEIVFYVGAAAAILLVALVPRRLIVALPVVLVVALAGASVAASRHAADSARERQAASLGPDPRWIDHAVSADVAYLYAPGANWVSVWETVFWNDAIRHVYGIEGAKAFGPLPQRPLALRRDGSFVSAAGRPVGPRYVVAPLGFVDGVPSYWFVGDIVTSVDRPDSRQGSLALWRVDPPLRLSFRSNGLAPNGDIYAGGDARLVAYGCRDRVFRVTLLVKGPQTVAIVRNGVLYRMLDFRSATGNEAWRAAIPATASNRATTTGTCTLDVRPTGLLGTTQFQVEG